MIYAHDHLLGSSGFCCLFKSYGSRFEKGKGEALSGILCPHPNEKHIWVVQGAALVREKKLIEDDPRFASSLGSL